VQKDFQSSQGIYENRLDEISSPTGSPHQIACGETDIHQRGVFGSDEDDRSRDEEEKERDIMGRRFVIMKFILVAILMGGVVLLGVSSCATVPKEPLASGEVRLLSIGVPGAGLRAGGSFAVNIFFEAVGNPQIKRACYSDSGEGPYCFDVSDVSYATLGTKGAFQMYLPGLSVGSHRVECYAEYIRDGETRKTNVVFTQISAGTGP
jgi:hypothetical protein